ncbi:Rossmann fold nucleotide-binding protein [Nocardioides panacisoli]|uniref:Rossmann fold nucleotide-binding protein n=1 Tax=Nocardioides panacisoli TaxID=627624 RepID=A0ABP7HZE6_9ACTN
MRIHRQRFVVVHGPDELDDRLAAADAPVDPRRDSLYTAADLYDTASYADSLDHRAYVWSRETQTSDAMLARALHDEGVDDALGAWIKGRSMVGVMGGHAVERGQPAYTDAARLGRLLAGRATVATGGGPGAMEATNLGARLSGDPDETLEEALARLAAAPSFRPSIDAWLAAARDVLSSYPGAVESLGVPTWHYGHEPPNPFATAIAKYFRNALREAILLLVCDAGIVFLPGAGGTVQEIFQDACENYYADEADVARMVLVGRRYWTEQLPAWPLLESLARGRPMESRIHLVDTVDEAATLF